MKPVNEMTVITFEAITPVEDFHNMSHRFHNAITDITSFVRIMATQNENFFGWYIETPSEHVAEVLEVIRSHFGYVGVVPLVFPKKRDA